MDLPIVSAAEMRVAEEAAFARGSSAEKLMDEAGRGVARAVQQFFPRPGECILFAGKGNNGGDAFVAAEFLQHAGWSIDLRLAFPENELSELARKKFNSASRRDMLPLGAQSRRDVLPLVHGRAEARPSVVLDGLLGLGAALPLREPIRSACRELNRLRREQNAYVFALDIPTGLDADSGDADSDAVRADFTIAIGAVKRGLVADHALAFVGRLEVVPLPGVFFRRDELPVVHGLAAASPSETVAAAYSLCQLLPRRDFGGYKNQYGRVGIVAGSKGLTGASILCSLGALRGGAGLVDLFVRDEIYNVVAASAAPEVMVKPVRSYLEAEPPRVDVWAIGPGLGQSHNQEVLELIRRTPQPMVIDADALTTVSEKMALLEAPAGPRLLTPHPGEMKRLFSGKDLSRAEMARRFTDQYPVTLLLKGSRTIVAENGSALSYNSTGNPGMATGGIGDTLTGVCAALMAQGLKPYDAARVGAWACGRAAEFAIFNGEESEESLIARDVSEHLGVGFGELHHAVLQSLD